MIRDMGKFKDFIENYLQILEDLVRSDKFKEGDAKFLSQLRSAERSFNFLLDQFPNGQVEGMFGREKWAYIKNRRTYIASAVSDAIDFDPDVKSRYNSYCEFLKDTRRLSNSL